jgi:hypothetical protein
VTNRLRWDPELTTARTGRPFYRDPLRLGLAIGAVVMMIGGFLPWAEGHVGYLHVQFGGLDGASDGLIMSTLGLVLLFIARSSDFLEAPDGGRRWAPMVIGLTCVGIWLLGHQRAELSIATWEDDAGGGSIVAGWWFAGLGVLIVAIIGSYVSLRHHEGETSSATALLRLPRRSDLVTLGATVGAIVGAAVGMAAATAIFPPSTVGAPLVFFFAGGFLAGAYGGRRLGRVARGAG